MCVCVFFAPAGVLVCIGIYVCVRACVRACVRVCVCVCVYARWYHPYDEMAIIIIIIVIIIIFLSMCICVHHVIRLRACEVRPACIFLLAQFICLHYMYRHTIGARRSGFQCGYFRFT